MFNIGHSKLVSIVGAITLLVMLAGQILPYSENCFGQEIVEVADLDDAEKDLDPDEKKEKLKAQDLKLMCEMSTALAVDFLFRQDVPSSPLLDILIPPPKQA